MYAEKRSTLVGALRAAGRAGVLIAMLVGPGAAVAEAQPDGGRQSFELELTSHRPRSSSGFAERIDYRNPADPQSKPPAVMRIVVRLPPGTEVDTSVPGRCQAPDPALIANGPAACSDESRVGDGLIVLDTGFAGAGRLISSDVTLLNGDDQVIFVFEERESGGRVVSRARVEGAGFITEVPPIPGGPPDGFTAIDLVELGVEAVDRGSDSYIRTPDSCPPSGAWISTGSFAYRDGVVQEAESASRCRGSGPGPSLPGRCANVERGSPGADRLTGSRRGDRLRGLGGADVLLGFAAADCLLGGNGPDRLLGGNGADLLKGQRGQDLIRAADRFRDFVDCGPGRRDRAVADRRDRVRRCEIVRLR